MVAKFLMPDDFAEFAADKSIPKICANYGISHMVAKRLISEMPDDWRKRRDDACKAIRVKSATASNKRRAKPLPASVLDDMATMSISAVAKKHGISYRRARAIRQDNGINRRPPVVPKRPANAIPTPDDFQYVAWRLTLKAIARHYKFVELTAKRMVSEQPLDWQLSRTAEVERLAQIRVHESKRAERRLSGETMNSWGRPYMAKERAYPFTREERATVFLQRFYCPVWHVGRERKALQGLYQVGKRRVDAETLVAMAKAKGWQG